MAEIPVLSLFSGVAGLDLGVRIALPGTRSIGYVEINVEAAEVLGARIKEGSIDDAPIYTDVRSFPSELYRGRVAGIMAGFPCPDYSVAGKRAGIVGKHGQLWDYTAAVIRDVGPDWVFLENVPGIYVPHGGDVGAVLPAGLWFVLGDLAALGFDAEWICLRASDVGASHGRARWFCLAYRKGGRLGELRKSSRGDGLSDGSDAEPGNATGNDERREPIAAMHGERITAGGSGGGILGTGSVVDPSRHERPGSHREAGTGRGVCGASDELDNSTGARCFDRESGSSAPPRDETRLREPDGRCDAMDDAELSERWSLSERGSSGVEGIDGGRQAPGRAGVTDKALADTEHPERWPEHEEYGNAHGRNGSGRIGVDVGHSDQPGLQGRQQRGHSADERAVGAAGDPELADADCGVRQSITGSGEGCEGDGGEAPCGGSIRKGMRGSVDSKRPSGDGYAELPLFAPGPGDPRWPAIIADFPWLAPAISEEEIESILRRMADGSAFGVDIEGRTDRLRAVGNGVCPLQAAAAFTVLARKAGLI